MSVTKISRRALVNNPENFGIDWPGGKFVNFLRGFEDREILPKPISAAANPDSPAKSEGFYFPAFIEMIKDLQMLRAGKRLSPLGIKEWLENKYARIYNLYDVMQLFRLRFLSRDLLLSYLDECQLTENQKDRIIVLYDNNPDFPTAKNAILDMLCSIK
ncbi:MAG: hypothetical protein JXK07_11835, partial [Spirochaetes bacterium]|nr:hypothetical protein [Spirochaetota bacterium]